MTNTPEPLHTQYADVASWELSDSLWERIEPLLPQVEIAQYRGRGQACGYILAVVKAADSAAKP